MNKLVPKLWYMFSEDILNFYFSPPKIIFYVFQSNLKKSTGLRWRWRWRWRWKIFHWEMLRKFSGQLPTYIGGHEKNLGTILELITFEILAAERLRLMEFDNRLIIDCFANVVNILIWQFSTNDRFKSEKYESLLGKSISRNELYWALFDKYFWLIVIMWRNRLIPINCNYFCWPSDYD